MSGKSNDYRYSIIPGGAVTDPNISMRDLQVLALLGRHTRRNGWCWRSQVEMAKELRCGRATISRSIKRLAEAGWVEQKALPRGRAILQEGQQPFSAFQYRVKIDREDEDEAASSDVPNNGHPPTDADQEVLKNGQGVPTASGQGVPTQMGTHRRIIPKDQPNSLAPAAPSERANGKSDQENHVTMVQVCEAFAAWPGVDPDFSRDDVTEAVKQVQRAADGPTLAELLACIQQRGRWLSETNAKRSQSAGMRLVEAPHRWIIARRWVGELQRMRERANEETAVTGSIATLRQALAAGAVLIDLMERRGHSKADIVGMLSGCRFEDGQAVVFRFDRPFHRNFFDQNFRSALERVLGKPVTVELQKRAAA